LTDSEAELNRKGSQILLYISAATDLEGERDILGRAVAEIPVDLNWRVAQSPRRSDPLDLNAVANADIHLLLLGGDIRAPIGLEWLTAQRAGRRPTLFLKQDVQRTSAALNFVRFVESQATWRPFKDGVELRQSVLEILTDHILDRAMTFVLSPLEIERLQGWRSDIQAESAAVDEETRGGAGDSSLILSRERFVPSEGVVIRPGEGQEPDRDEP
jgi:hypothetical protein